jgi:tetratricopeptide (TPR) repeat protein
MSDDERDERPRRRPARPAPGGGRARDGAARRGAPGANRGRADRGGTARGARRTGERDDDRRGATRAGGSPGRSGGGGAGARRGRDDGRGGDRRGARDADSARGGRSGGRDRAPGARRTTGERDDDRSPRRRTAGRSDDRGGPRTTGRTTRGRDSERGWGDDRGRAGDSRGRGRSRDDQRRGRARSGERERRWDDDRPSRSGDRRGARGRERERDDGPRGRRADAPGDRSRGRGPGHPSLPIRGRIVEYPSPRYRTRDEGDDNEARGTSARRPALRKVQRDDVDRRSAKPAKGAGAKAAGAKKPTKPAAQAAKQGQRAPTRRRGRRTEAGDELARFAGRHAARAQAALERAATAYSEGRERDAARELRALRDAYPDAAGVRELLGLTDYRLGHYGVAAKELEAFVNLTGSVEQHPVLMDCYRAQRRFDEVEHLWLELAETSPSAELVTEGRIVAAGALADQGRVRDAIALLERKAADASRPKEHHLRLWYALADLYERAGELPRARELFDRVRKRAPDFVDVAERLAALG